MIIEEVKDSRCLNETFLSIFQNKGVILKVHLLFHYDMISKTKGLWSVISVEDKIILLGFIKRNDAMLAKLILSDYKEE